MLLLLTFILLLFIFIILYQIIKFGTIYHIVLRLLRMLHLIQLLLLLLMLFVSLLNLIFSQYIFQIRHFLHPFTSQGLLNLLKHPISNLPLNKQIRNLPYNFLLTIHLQKILYLIHNMLIF